METGAVLLSGAWMLKLFPVTITIIQVSYIVTVTSNKKGDMMENSETSKKQRGRPATGTALSDADRARKYRLRAVDSQDLENEQCTFNQLLMRLADLHKNESTNYYLIRLALDELIRRNEKNEPD